MTGFKIILHPTDLSVYSMAAFRVACALAREGARLIIVHVMEKGIADSKGYLEALNEELRQLTAPDVGVNIEFHLREGRATVEILHVAEEVHCDLIVMGSHGRTGLRRLLTGSVAEDVLRQARCPVLMVGDRFAEVAHGEVTSADEELQIQM